MPRIPNPRGAGKAVVGAGRRAVKKGAKTTRAAAKKAPKKAIYRMEKGATVKVPKKMDVLV